MKDKHHALLEVVFSCNEDEINNLRTCVSSFIVNMNLVCETMKAFGSWV